MLNPIDVSAAAAAGVTPTPDKQIALVVAQTTPLYILCLQIECFAVGLVTSKAPKRRILCFGLEANGTTSKL